MSSIRNVEQQARYSAAQALGASRCTPRRRFTTGASWPPLASGQSRESREERHLARPQPAVRPFVMFSGPRILILIRAPNVSSARSPPHPGLGRFSPYLGPTDKAPPHPAPRAASAKASAGRRPRRRDGGPLAADSHTHWRRTAGSQKIQRQTTRPWPGPPPSPR